MRGHRGFFFPASSDDDTRVVGAYDHALGVGYRTPSGGLYWAALEHDMRAPIERVRDRVGRMEPCLPSDTAPALLMPARLRDDPQTQLLVESPVLFRALVDQPLALGARGLCWRSFTVRVDFETAFLRNDEDELEVPDELASIVRVRTAPDGALLTENLPLQSYDQRIRMRCKPPSSR
jgi:hypothetical protein